MRTPYPEAAAGQLAGGCLANWQRPRTSATRLRSSGIVTIDVGATAFDPAGRPAKAARRQVVQAPRGDAIHLAWDSQDELEVLRVDRRASNMATWPQAVERLSDILPETNPWVARAAAAHLPTVAMLEWRVNLAGGRNRSRPLSGTTSTFLLVPDQAAQTPADQVPAGDVQPDGLQIWAVRQLRGCTMTAVLHLAFGLSKLT